MDLGKSVRCAGVAVGHDSYVLVCCVSIEACEHAHIYNDDA